MRRKPPPTRAASRRARILLVDDHPLVRERLTEIINREADLMVSGEAEDRHQALAAIAAKQPDLAIIDLTLKTFGWPGADQGYSAPVAGPADAGCLDA